MATFPLKNNDVTHPSIASLILTHPPISAFFLQDFTFVNGQLLLCTVRQHAHSHLQPILSRIQGTSCPEQTHAPKRGARYSFKHWVFEAFQTINDRRHFVATSPSEVTITQYVVMASCGQKRTTWSCCRCRTHGTHNHE